MQIKIIKKCPIKYININQYKVLLFCSWLTKIFYVYRYSYNTRPASISYETCSTDKLKFCNIKLQDSLKCNISREKCIFEVYFWNADKHQSFLQVDTIILGVGSQSCQSNQNKKFCISLRYVWKNVGSEVEF